MENNEAAYIAGLFDGEGSVDYKKRLESKVRRGKKRKYYCWRISLEMSMTDESVVKWVHETLGVGTFNKKPRGRHKMQWRWRCCFRDALYVAKLLWPYAIVKLHKLEQIIDHYEPRAQELGDNIVDLETERAVRQFNWNVHGT